MLFSPLNDHFDGGRPHPYGEEHGLGGNTIIPNYGTWKMREPLVRRIDKEKEYSNIPKYKTKQGGITPHDNRTEIYPGVGGGVEKLTKKNIL